MVVLILHLFCLLQVIDINEPPTDINLSNNTIVENSKIGTIIGHLTVSDPDHNQTHSCALIRNPFQTFEITSTLSSGNRDQFFPSHSDAESIFELRVCKRHGHRHTVQ